LDIVVEAELDIAAVAVSGTAAVAGPEAESEAMLNAE
jgi:hypothetical protein